MAIVRVMVTIPRDSAIEEDTVSNTFHFSTQNPVPDSAFTIEQIEQRVEDFYKLPGGGGANALVAYMANDLNTSIARIRMYDMADAEPRIPFLDNIHDLGVAGGTSLPSEVALRLSTRAALVSGVNRARLRGGLYFGPLGGLAYNVAAGTARPTAQVLAALALSARRLIDESEAASTWAWVIYSSGARDNSDKSVPYKDRPLLPPIVNPIVSAYVDDAFDTQRPRGVAASARVPA